MLPKRDRGIALLQFLIMAASLPNPNTMPGAGGWVFMSSLTKRGLWFAGANMLVHTGLLQVAKWEKDGRSEMVVRCPAALPKPGVTITHKFENAQEFDKMLKLFKGENQ